MRINRRRVQVSVKPQQDREFTLVLTERQAEALQRVLGTISGHPDTSRRGYIKDIYDALDAAGVSYRIGDPNDDFKGSGNFRDIY